MPLQFSNGLVHRDARALGNRATSLKGGFALGPSLARPSGTESKATKFINCDSGELHCYHDNCFGYTDELLFVGHAVRIFTV